MTMADKKETLLDVHKDGLETFGFWMEIYKETLIKLVAKMYKDEVLKEYYVSDVLLNGEKVLVKWHKRRSPLSDEELKETYGR